MGVFGYNALFFTALKYTSVTNGALIIAAMPIFTIGYVIPIVATLLAVFAYGSSITLTQIVGMVMVLIGV
ncbi:hypothetical protein [Paenibacillus lutimineralis]|uniref:hypothetical protein n=1 Tax=Paenibacillus lutimineralis TaxID=2707005 RepID=UPI003AB8070A